MLTRDRRPRPQSSPSSENLESRRLLVATPIQVGPGLAFALGLPVPGLAYGMGMATPSQTLPTVTVSVSPVPVAAVFGPSATGPSTTLSPLPNDSETAVAAASEVARPTPGRSDRISSIVEPSPIILLPHLQSPEPVEVIPGPEIQLRPPAPAPTPLAPAQPPAEPAAPARPFEVIPSPVPKAAPVESKGPIGFEIWDAAINLVANEFFEDLPVSITGTDQGSMAVGALLAAWGSWKYGSRFESRSRRRSLLIAGVDGRISKL